MNNKTKTVLANQLKNTIAYVYDTAPSIANEDGSRGEELGAIFSTKSLYNRIVNSPFLIGMSNTLLVEGSKKVADLYFSSK